MKVIITVVCVCLYYLDLIDLFVIYQSADLNNREQSLMKTILVMNLEVKDNHEEAAIGGRLASELCQEVSNQIKKYIYIHSIVVN